MLIKACASGGSGSSKSRVSSKVSGGIPMGVDTKAPVGVAPKSSSTAASTNKAENDYYKPGNFSTLKGDLQSDLKVVNNAPIGSTVRINWGSSSTYARKTSSGNWVSDSGTKYSNRDVASNADFWTAITINTMVR